MTTHHAFREICMKSALMKKTHKVKSIVSKPFPFCYMFFFFSHKVPYTPFFVSLSFPKRLPPSDCGGLWHRPERDAKLHIPLWNQICVSKPTRHWILHWWVWNYFIQRMFGSWGKSLHLKCQNHDTYTAQTVCTSKWRFSVIHLMVVSCLQLQHLSLYIK